MLNYDIIHAPKIVLPSHTGVDFWIIGCGGTGSFLVQLVCRIALMVQQAGRQCRITLVDPDWVELQNLTRQCFCRAEIGMNKAQTLAARYSAAWETIEIRAIPTTLDLHWFNGYPDSDVQVVFGCVDRGSSRRVLASLLTSASYSYHSQYAARRWWIDCGNGERYGQVLVGSNLSLSPDTYTFSPLGCRHFPAPNLQAPELLDDKPEELEDAPTSCAQFATGANAQGITVNIMTATIAADLATDLVQGNLRRYAVYFDQSTGSMQSRWISQQAIEVILAQHQPAAT